MGGIALGILSAFGYIFFIIAPSAQLLAFLVWSTMPDWDAQDERIEHLNSFLRDYDVVCLQELTVFWGVDSYVEKVRAGAARLGLVHFASAGRWPAPPSNFAASGLEVLSRLPILRSKAFSFARQSWFEWSFIQRGALMVELMQPDNTKIAVLNVHTTSGLEVLESGLGKRSGVSRGNSAGLDQLFEALDRFKEFSAGADHRIFCGDFNLHKGSVGFQMFEAKAKEHGLFDSFPNSPPTFGCVDAQTGEPTETLLTKTADHGTCKILDHIFSNKLCSSARVEPLAAPRADGTSPMPCKFQQVSDHRGVAAVYE